MYTTLPPVWPEMQSYLSVTNWLDVDGLTGGRRKLESELQAYIAPAAALARKNCLYPSRVEEE